MLNFTIDQITALMASIIYSAGIEPSKARSGNYPAKFNALVTPAEAVRAANEIIEQVVKAG